MALIPVEVVTLRTWSLIVGLRVRIDLVLWVFHIGATVREVRMRLIEWLVVVDIAAIFDCLHRLGILSRLAVLVVDFPGKIIHKGHMLLAIDEHAREFLDFIIELLDLRVAVVGDDGFDGSIKITARVGVTPSKIGDECLCLIAS